MSLALTYAKALYETAREEARNGKPKNPDLSEERKQLLFIWELLEKSKEARVALLGPATSAREKADVVRALGEKAGFSPLVVRFLELLARKGRLAHLREMIKALDQVRLKAEGGVLGELVSADPLDPKDLETLTKAFEKKLNQKVEFVVTTDPDLLAGLKITVNGVTYDGTLRSQLERLKENFIKERTETLH